MGEEECAHCNMMISDQQFASQLVTSTGRHYSFDAIECMAAYTADFDGEIHSLWVRDYYEYEEWIDATQATFVQSDEIPSPMSVNISAYKDREDAQQQVEDVIDWEDVKRLVADQWGNRH